MPVSSLPGHLARRFHQLSTALFDVEMQRSGIDLTPVQYAALAAIFAKPEIDQASLAGLIGYDRTTIGGVVDRLCDKGFVARSTNPGDRRAKVLVATPAGAAILERANEIVRAAQEQLVAGLDPSERKQLVQLLEKAITALGDVSRTSR